MDKVEKIVVGISIGDLNGIGIEVILKTFEDKRMLDFCTPVFLALQEVVHIIKKLLNSEAQIHGITSIDQLVITK